MILFPSDTWYAWYDLLDPDILEYNIVFYEYSPYCALYQKLPPNAVYLNIDRVYKDIGFELLNPFFKCLIPETKSIRKSHEFIGAYDKCIAKPSNGARRIGIFLGKPEDMYSLSINPKIDTYNDDELIDYITNNFETFEFCTKESEKSMIAKSVRKLRYIVQPYIEDYIHEIRIYASPYSVFDYAQLRPNKYLVNNNPNDIKIVSVSEFHQLDLNKIINFVYKFNLLTGRHFPFLSLDIIITADEQNAINIIDYGIEFSFSNYLKDQTIFLKFKEWLNEQVNTLCFSLVK